MTSYRIVQSQSLTRADESTVERSFRYLDLCEKQSERDVRIFLKVQPRASNALFEFPSMEPSIMVEFHQNMYP